MEGLATIPHHLKEVGLEKRRRSESRDRSVSRSRKRRRIKEEFSKGDRVSIQNSESGEWTVPGIIVGRRDHNGIDSSSYLIRNQRTNRLISHSEKHIRLLKPSPTSNTSPESLLTDNSPQNSPKTLQNVYSPIVPTPGPTAVSAERAGRGRPGRPSSKRAATLGQPIGKTAPGAGSS